MPPNYTTYMTFPEAQRALGIIEERHFERILLAHLTRHERRAEANELRVVDGDVVVRGSTAKEMASCEDCYPALISARRERTTHRAEAIVTDL